MNTYVIAVALIRFAGKYLVAKRAPTKKFAPGEWEFISGFMDAPGTVEENIMREIKEETGLDGKIVRAGKAFEAEDGYGRWVIVPYLVDAKSGSFKANEGDHSEMKWVDKKEFANIPELKDYLEKDRIHELIS